MNYAEFEALVDDLIAKVRLAQTETGPDASYRRAAEEDVSQARGEVLEAYAGENK